MKAVGANDFDVGGAGARRHHSNRDGGCQLQEPHGVLPEKALCWFQWH
jgi:hypothetical protein